VVDGEGLGDLEETDQLKPVQALGAGLVALHLGQPCMHRRVGGDEAVDVGESEVPAHGVHHRVDRGVHQPALAETAHARQKRSWVVVQNCAETGCGAPARHRRERMLLRGRPRWKDASQRTRRVGAVPWNETPGDT